MRRLGLWVIATFLLNADAAFNCKFKYDAVEYDLTPLSGLHTLVSSETTPPTVSNTTWFINPCGPLDMSEVSKDERCPDGTEICGVEKIFSPKEQSKGVLRSVIPVAGDLDGNQSGATVEKLDGDKKGVKVTYSGGKWGDKKDLGATIEFSCDEKEEVRFVGWDGSKLKVEWSNKYACGNSNPPSDGDKGGDEKEPEKKPDNGQEEPPKDPPANEPKEESSWGFFTWFFFIAVLLFAVYVVGGAWVNYSRYGLTGVDLLPHSDAVRDFPYLIRDFIKKVINTFSGSSRGGYSAV